MNWITVKEMSEQYGISHQCIYKKIDHIGNELTNHIRRDSKRGKLLDEVAVEQLRPKNKTPYHRRSTSDELRDTFISCEHMCSENADGISALSKEFHLSKENVMRKLMSITADIQRIRSAENEQLTFSDDTANIEVDNAYGEGC